MLIVTRMTYGWRSTEGRLLARKQITHDVLAFVPLAPRHRGLAGEELVHRFPQALGTVDHTQHALIDVETVIEQAPQKLDADQLVLRGRLHEARNQLFAFDRDAQRDHHLAFAEGLAIEEEAYDVLARQGQRYRRRPGFDRHGGAIAEAARNRLRPICDKP